MSRRLLLTALAVSFTCMTMGVTVAARAATVPSQLMLPDPGLAARGVAERWLVSIRLESTDLKAIEPCRQVLAARGYAPLLSKTASSSMPELHFKIEGGKEYPQASDEADQTLAAVQQAGCGGALSWTVTSRPVAVAPR